MSLLEFSPTVGVTQVWSCGGGTQSAAIAALICQGKLPKPDLSVIVDTGREKSSTWRYVDNVLRPALAKVGVEIHRVSKDEYATVDLYRGDDILIPAFTILNGSHGKLPGFCSNEWKQRVTMRWLAAQGVFPATHPAIPPCLPLQAPPEEIAAVEEVAPELRQYRASGHDVVCVPISPTTQSDSCAAKRIWRCGWRIHFWAAGGERHGD